MFFKKKILLASIYYNTNKTFLVTYSKDTNGLNFMSYVKELNIRTMNSTLFGEECLIGLKEFKTGAPPPKNVSIEIMPLLNKMNCNSWNSLFKKYYSIRFEGINEKYVTIQPSIKKTEGRSKFYATNQEEVVKVNWDKKIVGDKIFELLNEY